MGELGLILTSDLGDRSHWEQLIFLIIDTQF